MISQTTVQKKKYVNHYRNPHLGRRTGVDILAGKVIRKDQDGLENFSDYITDIEDSEVTDLYQTSENESAKNVFLDSKQMSSFSQVNNTSSDNEAKNSKRDQRSLLKPNAQKNLRNNFNDNQFNISNAEKNTNVEEIEELRLNCTSFFRLGTGYNKTSTPKDTRLNLFAEALNKNNGKTIATSDQLEDDNIEIDGTPRKIVFSLKKYANKSHSSSGDNVNVSTKKNSSTTNKSLSIHSPNQIRNNESKRKEDEEWLDGDAVLSDVETEEWIDGNAVTSGTNDNDNENCEHLSPKDGPKTTSTSNKNKKEVKRNSVFNGSRKPYRKVVSENGKRHEREVNKKSREKRKIEVKNTIEANTDDVQESEDKHANMGETTAEDIPIKVRKKTKPKPMHEIAKSIKQNNVKNVKPLKKELSNLKRSSRFLRNEKVTSASNINGANATQMDEISSGSEILTKNTSKKETRRTKLYSIENEILNFSSGKENDKSDTNTDKPKNNSKKKNQSQRPTKTLNNRPLHIPSDSDFDSETVVRETETSLPSSPNKTSSVGSPRSGYDIVKVEKSINFLRSLNPSRKQPQLIFPDDNDEGLRRSKRIRVQPLEYWRNEQLQYKNENKQRVIAGIFSPAADLPVLYRNHFKNKKSNLKKKDNNTKREITLGNLEEVSSQHFPVLNSETEEIVFIGKTAARNYKGPTGQPATDEDPYILCLTSEQKAFTQGHITIRPKAEKPMEYLEGYTLLFYVAKGKLLVTIHCTSFIAEIGDTFFVPMGNKYSLKNVRIKEEAHLTFAQLFNGDV